MDALLAATAEMVRVLKPTGSIFVNLGDKYAGSGGNNQSGLGDPRLMKGTIEATQAAVATGVRNGPRRYNQNSGGIPAKSLMGLPWRYAIGCIDQLGLILRAEVIWSKPNGLPESVTDRVRRSHEQWFHMVKSPRYFSAVDEVREAHIYPNDVRGESWRRLNVAATDHRSHSDPNPLGKLPGSVWTIATEPLIVPDAVKEHYGLPDHFAAFPQEWPRRIILGWSPSGVCVACGEGRRPVIEYGEDYAKLRGPGTDWNRDRRTNGATYDGNGDRRSTEGRPTADRQITGYACACPEPTADTTPAVVLDPFGGTGTVALVARALGRTGLTFDLSSDYCRLARWRIHHSGHGAKTEQRTWADQQMAMF